MIAIGSEKQAALDWVEANRKRLSQFHQQIWHYAETAFREYRSARAYCELLRAEGFQVEEGSAGMPTAFLATFGEGRPVLGTYAEYDAVPENSQQPVPYRAPREGLHPWAPGHTDPHSALGVAALAGVLGAKAAMARHGLRGTLRFFGEPAEKVCGSKPVHAAKGYYDGADAYISYHPGATSTTVWDTHCGAYWSAVFTFECLDPETWIDQSLLPFLARAHARDPGADCPGAREERAARGREHGMPALEPLGHQDARRSREPRAGRSDLPQPGARGAARSRRGGACLRAGDPEEPRAPA